MRRSMWGVGVIIIVCVAFLATAVGATARYDVNVDAGIDRTVLFIGDSNVTKSASTIMATVEDRSDGFLPIFASRSGMGIRGYSLSTEDASEYWQVRLARVLAIVHPRAIVIDLGINDSTRAGTRTTTGYASYGHKIDWLMAQLPDVPVLWTNLPCAIEETQLRDGCDTINAALENATSRNPNLSVLAWSARAGDDAGYMIAGQPHLTTAGQTAWSDLVLAALDKRFPPST